MIARWDLDELIHSEDELYHHGVMGMRWGHRKVEARRNRIVKRQDRGSWGSKAEYKVRKQEFKEIKEKYGRVTTKLKNDKQYNKLLDKYVRKYNEARINYLGFDDYKTGLDYLKKHNMEYRKVPSDIGVRKRTGVSAKISSDSKWRKAKGVLDAYKDASKPRDENEPLRRREEKTRSDFESQYNKKSKARRAIEDILTPVNTSNMGKTPKERAYDLYKQKQRRPNI